MCADSGRTGETAREGTTGSPSPAGTEEVGTFVENAGVRIHYEVLGSGPPLLLHHGFTSSADAWRQWGYFDGLKDDFRLIAIDAHGHGQSDKPHDAQAYTMELRTGDVAAVLDAAGVERAHYWGYSMGGRTGFAFVQRFPERVASFINGAAGPTSSGALEEQRIRRWAAALETGEPDAIAASLNLPVEAVRPLLEGNDLKALAAAQLGLLSWPAVDASALDVPSFHYAGENDPLLPVTRAAAEAMPGAVFKVIPGLNHLTGFARSDLVLPLVSAFLSAQNAVQ